MSVPEQAIKVKVIPAPSGNVSTDVTNVKDLIDQVNAAKQAYMDAIAARDSANEYVLTTQSALSILQTQLGDYLTSINLVGGNYSLMKRKED